MSVSGTAPLAEQIEDRIDRAVRSGRVPQVILDLDGTLFDNTPRTHAILSDAARDLYGPDAPIVRRIDGMERAAFEYNPVDTLRKHGITDEDTLVAMREAWADRFFNSEFLHHDLPLAGAEDAVRGWWKRGAEINYLTGRHVPEMYLGTCGSLAAAGLPVGTTRTQLLMKPSWDLEDIAFKVEALPALLRKGPIELIVDNDPRVLNPLSERVPEALSILMRTLHPVDAPEPHGHLPEVRSFRDLTR